MAIPFYSFSPPPSGDAPEAKPARIIIPKNLTIRFGALRASIYGSSTTAKMAPFGAIAKDPDRKFNARDFIHKPVRLKILDEEFPDNQKLLDDMAVYPTPVTLACIPSLAAVPSSSD